MYVRAKSIPSKNPVYPAPGVARPPLEWTSLGGIFVQPPALTSWEPDRLDLFGIGQDGAMYHKVWGTPDGWWPSDGWQPLGGQFTSAPLTVSCAAGQLDVFGLGKDRALWHKQWINNGWRPGGLDWKSLGGEFSSLPAVKALSGDRLFVCGVGMDESIYFSSRLGGRWTAPGTWRALGGRFTSTPAVVDNGLHVDILAVGMNDDLYRRHLVGPKDPDPNYSWQPMNGGFTSAAGVAHLGRASQDAVVFGLGKDHAMWHRTYDLHRQEMPSSAWFSLGGVFTSAPAVVATSDERIDVFGLGLSTGVFHKAWDRDHWDPSGEAWKNLGGRFLHSGATTASGNGGGGGDTQRQALTLSLVNQSPGLQVLSATWRLWLQKPTGVELARVLPGEAVTIPGLASGQYQVRVDAAVHVAGVDEVQDVEFRGNGAVIDGLRTHVLVWNGTSTTHQFALRLEQRSVDGREYSGGVVTYLG